MAHRSTPAEVGKLTGLPLSKFATAELIARAKFHGFDTLWEYVEHLETLRSKVEEALSLVEAYFDGGDGHDLMVDLDHCLRRRAHA